MKTFELKYGSSRIGLNLDASKVIEVLAPTKLSSLSDIPGRVKKVLNYPISSKPLREIVSSGEKVAIVVSDRTRNIAASVFLPVLINELNSSGIPDKDIFIMFSLGTHRKHTKEEHRKIVGDEIADRIKLFDHDCNDEKNLVKIGTTTRGTPVKINKLVNEADRVILTGAITYHYFAGYGGGRKAVLPGISSFDTIQANHMLTLAKGSASTGVLKGNPVHEDMIEAARMLDPDMILNVILDDSGRVAAVFAGELEAAHRAGCEALDNYCKVKINEKAGFVIASSGGGSKDLNFVQSHKAMEMASYALNEGGTMLLLAESGEGFPSGEYMKYVNLGSAKAIEEELHRKFTIPGHTILSAFKKAERFRIIWVSKLDEAIIKKFGITPAKNLTDAMNLIEEIVPCYVMPEAYNTFPVVSG